MTRLTQEKPWLFLKRATPRERRVMLSSSFRSLEVLFLLILECAIYLGANALLRVRNGFLRPAVTIRSLGTGFLLHRARFSLQRFRSLPRSSFSKGSRYAA